MKEALTGISGSTLRALAKGLRTNQIALPVTDFNVSKVVAVPARLLVQLQQLSGQGIQREHLALLLEGWAEAAEARLTTASDSELVWTGPESSVAQSRDTAAVLSELFSSADSTVLISTFVVRQGAQVFQSLAARMDAVPGLAVKLFVHVGRVAGDARHESELLREFAAGLAKQWPSSRRPSAYYDPRGLLTDNDQRATWHAKCVVIDDRVAFVTSANFTEWASQRNVEAGVLIRNQEFAKQLRAQFDGLVQRQHVARLPGF